MGLIHGPVLSHTLSSLGQRQMDGCLHELALIIRPLVLALRQTGTEPIHTVSLSISISTELLCAPVLRKKHLNFRILFRERSFG